MYKRQVSSKEDGEEDISQPQRKMERKTSATAEDGEEDISHEGRRRGRYQSARRKMERKTSATEEDGEEDINHEGRRRGREQRPPEGMKTVPAVQPRSALCKQRNTRRSRHCVEVIFNAGLALCKQRSTCTSRGNVWRSLSMHVQHCENKEA